jgi:hypothetical protein
LKRRFDGSRAIRVRRMKMLRSDQHLLNLDFVEFDFEDARSPLPTLAKASHALSRAVFGFIAVAHLALPRFDDFAKSFDDFKRAAAPV